MDIRFLVNMVSEDGKRSCSHGVRAAVIKKQTEALGIPIVQKPTTTEIYETVFINTLKELKQKGIEVGGFADIAKLDKGITSCGEAGEFHTLVIDGPIFQKRLDLIKTEKVSRGEHHFLE